MLDLSKTPVEIQRLGSVAEVLPGFSTGSRLEHDTAGTHQVVLSKHLTPGLSYRYQDADVFRINPNAPSERGIRTDDRTRDVARYKVYRGDVLFMSRGVRNVATRIADVPEGSIAPVSFFIIRAIADMFSSSIDPSYLVWYLNSPRAQADIGNIRTGAGTPIVQRAGFQDLAVPFPNLETQRRIGELGEMMVRERLLHDQLTAAIARGHEATSSTIAARLFATGESQLGDAE